MLQFKGDGQDLNTRDISEGIQVPIGLGNKNFHQKLQFTNDQSF